MNFWEIITMFGDLKFWIAASIMNLIVCMNIPRKLRKYLVWFVFLVLPSVVISYSITSFLKLIFKVPRPCFSLNGCPQTFSFPSGHATVAFAALTVIALYYKNKKIALFLLLFACLVSYSRVVLNVHYFEDIVAGSFIGIATAVTVWKTYESTNFFNRLFTSLKW